MKRFKTIWIFLISTLSLFSQENLVYLDTRQINPDAIVIKGQNNNVIIGNDLVINYNSVPKAVTDKIDAKYQEKLKRIEEAWKALKIDGKEKKEKLSVVKQERETAIEQAAQLQEKFKTIDIEKSNDLYKKAFQAFQEGQISSAINLLEAVKLDNEDRKNADNRKMRASLFAINYEFNKAEENYEIAVRIYSDYENHYDFADFLYTIHKYNKSIDQLSYADRYANEPFKKHEILEKKGNIYLSTEDFKSAISTLKALLLAIDQLEEKFDFYKQASRVVTWLTLGRIEKIVADNTLGEMLNKMGDIKSRQFMEENDVDPVVARIFGKGALFIDTMLEDSIRRTIPMYSDSDSCYAIARRLTDKPFPVTRSTANYMVSILMNFAQHSALTKQYEEALGYQKKLLKVLDMKVGDGLLFEDSEKTELQKARLFREIAMVYSDLNEHDSAAYYCKRSIDIFRRKEADDFYADELGKSFFNLGLIQNHALNNYIKEDLKKAPSEERDLNVELLKVKFAAALDCFLESKKIFERLYNKYPEGYSDELGQAELCAGMVFKNFGEYEEARKFFQHALQLFEKVNISNSFIIHCRYFLENNLADRTCARDYRNIGFFYEERGDFQIANKYYNKSYGYYESLLKTNKKEYLRQYREICDFRAHSYKKLGQYEMSIGYYNEWLSFEDSNENCNKETDCLNNKIIICGNLAEIYIYLDQPNTSITYFAECVAFFDRIEQLDAKMVPTKITSVLINYASVLLNDNRDYDFAKQLLTRAEKLASIEEAAVDPKPLSDAIQTLRKSYKIGDE